MDIVLNGIKFGIVLAFLIGPVFFSLIQTSVERGFGSGLIMALGVSLSDIMYVAICYFGIFQFVNDPRFRTQMAYVGGSILILFGLYHLIIKSRRKAINIVQSEGERSRLRYFFKGFILNGLSPMVPLFWIGTISFASINLGYTEGANVLIFFTALLVTVLITDIIKAYLAGKLRAFINTRVLRIVNVILGIGLIGFGVRLMMVVQS